ncbi:hypothetical protein BaRGS_00007797 [Batillaria attramentaria]|uniref:Uncharacterized protein n=1 Tax=Batillaria attramentaria TaxID=370345 RepID=A0ABD0LNK6_9CAEN
MGKHTQKSDLLYWGGRLMKKYYGVPLRGGGYGVVVGPPPASLPNPFFFLSDADAISVLWLGISGRVKHGGSHRSVIYVVGALLKVVCHRLVFCSG